MGIRTSYLGRPYFANVLFEGGAKTTIYLSQVDNACTEGDKAISLNPSVHLFDAGSFQQACGTYKNWDNATKIAGCLSVVSSVFCGLATIPTDGAAALFCTSVWEYAADKGAADCLKGIAGEIAEELKGSIAWAGFAAVLAISEQDYTDMLTSMLDLFCDKNINPALDVP